MYHGEAQLGEHPLHLVPHPNHVVVFVQSAGVVVRGLVNVGAVGRVGLAAVGVDDENLGPSAGRAMFTGAAAAAARSTSSPVRL